MTDDYLALCADLARRYAAMTEGLQANQWARILGKPLPRLNSYNPLEDRRVNHDTRVTGFHRAGDCPIILDFVTTWL